MFGEDEPTLEQLLTPNVVEDLEDRIPLTALVIVETMGEHGSGLRFYTSGQVSWHSVGMLRSVMRRLEQRDLDEWEGPG